MVALLPLSGTDMSFLGVLAHGLFGEHRQRAKRQHERVYFAHTPHLLNRGSHATGLHVHFLTEGACMSLKSNTFAELIKSFLFFSFFFRSYSVVFLLERSPLSQERDALHRQINQA